METSLPKVVVIVGPTASGKTSLSIKLADTFHGEVVSADSRQVYRGLDLGSGKVTREEMGDIPHHLLDVASPATIYTAADFARDAAAAVDSIIDRGRLPIIAGGTFMYVDTLLGKISTPNVSPNPTLRAQLEEKSIPELIDILSNLDKDRLDTVDTQNPRRLIRAIEIATAIGHVPKIINEPKYHTLILGIDIPKETLHHNIHLRLIDRLQAGMLDEVKGLIAAGVTHQRLEDLGLEYRYLSRYLRNEMEYDDMVLELETKTKQFAKRQLTWLKRDKDIVWVNPKDITHINSLITDFLSK